MVKAQRSHEELTKHKQSVSARKTMFQDKKNIAKAAAAAEAHEKPKAEASAPRKIAALADSSDESDEGEEGRHLSEEERIDVPSEQEDEAENTDPPAISAEAERNSAPVAPISSPSSTIGQGQTLSVNPSPQSNPSRMPPPAPKTPSVLVPASREIFTPPFLPPLVKTPG